ncbi:peroxisome proliferator-activated receptor gamma coactivator-related protein 1 [Toxotes jaculatrix]|uniref:peroxisome proliferator-activated receptor gamma coactivator-related protein 1 n=1 Tax=Toxotes jaculatrix TaxID=941984 RepID=UPI001B3AA41F|nr:peroxisome proliferator-activated receptor gamma coactivator-related protein 1 [Toxotes jaculatrix]
MAARWGAGEETLIACNMEFFPMDTLDETAGLSSGETLEVLHGCLDPSILSIFEDTPTIETKGLDEESDATLLTALTEILDNVDDENLSPFDTLPDSDLLSGQKGREHSPLRRLLCLSRSPPEKDTLCSARPISTGKSLPRMQVDSLQRSDGEEEDDGSLTLSPVRQDSSPDNELLDWEGSTLLLPNSFEQEGEDGVSVSLGDLVRNIHPYCMAICVENDDGEQMLPEGGILLEVVDQGENGEPILAIQDTDLPVFLPLTEQASENEQILRDEAKEVASDSSEHIVVDDEDVAVDEAPVKVTAPATPDLCTNVKDEMVIKKQKEEVKKRSPSRRKKKKKCKEQRQPEPVEGRILRSGTVRKMAQEVPRKPERRSVKEEKKQQDPQVLISATSASSSVKPKKLNPCQTEKQKTEITTTTLLPEMNVQVATCDSLRQDTSLLEDIPEKSQPSGSPTAVSSQQPDEAPEQLGPAPEKLEDSSAAPSAVLAPLSSESPAAAASAVTLHVTPPVCEALPPVAIALPEPKPKSLSLEEYRRLRQQKKPTPVEKQDDNSTKWPSLPELPKELTPIPCLPDPSPRDSRRPSPQAAKKELEEVKPAWQPRGPAAPPTPEALLVPPAYMVASSTKVSAATAVPKPQQTPEPSKPSLPKNSSAPVPDSVKDLPTHQHTIAQPTVPSVPQSSGSPASLKHATQFTSSADGKCSPVLSGEKGGVRESPQSQPVSLKSAELSKACPKTTTESIKPTAATLSTPSVPHKTTVVSQKVPEVTAATTLNTPITAGSKSSKPTTNGTQLCSSSAAHTSDIPQSLKAEPDVLETKENPTTIVKPQRPKSPTQELIEAFTSEIGIEAADLTSLLEQFEETQAKEEQFMPEVSGRAAAVGNSSFESAPEKTAVERVKANDLSSTAALTPPATPPHQMWKPLAPVALLGKSKATEASKSSPSKVIQIEARPLPSVKSRSKPTPAAATVDPDLACMDHDYCIPNKGTSTGEPGKRWNVKQQSFITIKPIKQPTTATAQTPPAVLSSSGSSATKSAVTTKTQDFSLPLHHRTDGMESSSVLETPDASPTRLETDSTIKEESPRRRGPFGRAYRRHAASRSPSPRSSPKERTGGRSRKRRSHRSPSPMSSGSESHSSRSRSRSHAPSRKRYRPRHSESSSSSSSRSSSRSSPSVSRSPPRRRRYSYSSSRSGSWSRSRSRSRSPQRRAQWGRSAPFNSSSYSHGYGHSAKTNTEEVKRRKEKAIEERRVVYVGRIRGTMTQKELKERFSYFGEIEECTLHFRDQGDNYGFVTYYNTKDAFTAIENGGKLRMPDELPFDLCFGGRRQFCQTGYSDLDSNREYDPLPAKGKFHAVDFDTLLKQAQQNLKR